MIPIVVIDFRVYAWDIHHKIKPLISADLVNEATKRKLIKALWAYKINRGPVFMDEFEHRIVVVTDSRDEDGDYWRNKHMRNDPRIVECWENWLAGHKRRKKPISYEYKGTRVGKDDISEVIEIGRDYVDKYIGTIYEQEGFEADDWAHLVYHYKMTIDQLKDRQVYLSTVDRDWSQLVDDEYNIALANHRQPSAREKFQDRLVTNQGVLDHTEHYSKHTISHPRELPFVKHLVGDSGDNLPPKAPQKYFDLINPPVRPSGHLAALLMLDLKTNKTNQKIEHMTQSEKLITQLGYPHYLC